MIVSKPSGINKKLQECVEFFPRLFKDPVKWVKVFKNGPSKICGRFVCPSRPHHSRFFKVYLPQVLLGPFLNTLT